VITTYGLLAIVAGKVCPAKAVVSNPTTNVKELIVLGSVVPALIDLTLKNPLLDEGSEIPVADENVPVPVT
jgi:hypothetical protein